MVNLAIESCLVQDIPDILSPADIGKMSAKALENLAAEDEITLARRKLLESEVTMLKEGLKECRRYKPRALTGKMSPRPNTQVVTSPVC